MTSLLLRRGWLRVFVIGMMLIFGLGGIQAASQISSPLPSRSQVIAQGGQSIGDQPVQWHIDFLTASPVAVDDAIQVNGAFVVAQDHQLVIGQYGLATSLLSPGQASYIPAAHNHQVYSASDEDAPFVTLSLIPAGSINPGTQSSPFALEPGRYNLQLTSGLMLQGETDTFQSPDSGYFMLMVTEGQVDVTQTGSDAVVPVATDAMMEFSGSIDMVATSEGASRYLVVSVGDRMPDLPVVETGSIVLHFNDCEAADLAAGNLDACIPNPSRLIGTLSQIVDGQEVTLSTIDDAVATTDDGWVIADVATGDWQFTLEDDAVQKEFALTGDVLEREDAWYVRVTPGEVANVQVFSTPKVGDGVLRVIFAECPSYWTPDGSVTDCVMMAGAPDLQITDTSNEEHSFIAREAGTVVEPGVYEITGMDPGLYRLALAYSDTWTFETTDLVWDAWYENGEWFVEVASGAPATVLVVHYAESGSPEPGDDMGSLVVIQLQCEKSDGVPDCIGSVDQTWEMRFTNNVTGEIFTLSQDGIETGNGTWQLTLPAGGYHVDAEDGDWHLEYPRWVDIYPNDESILQVNAFPQ